MLARAAFATLCTACVAQAAHAGQDALSATADTATPVHSFSLSYAQSTKLIEAGIAAAHARHLAMSFAIVDPGGHLIAAARMDGAPFASVDFARGKAFASVALGGQSGVTLEQRYRDDPSEYSNVSGAGYYAPFLPGRGVFPVYEGRYLLGALGASGAPSEIDDQVVKTAIESIGATTVR